MRPGKFGGKVDEWRAWKRDFTDFLGAQNKGMGAFLRLLSESVEWPTPEWFTHQGRELGERVVSDHSGVWRTLKALTEGVALTQVLGASAGGGLAAGHKLSRHLEPSLGAM